MKKIYKVLVSQGKEQAQRTIDLQQGAGDRGEVIRIKAKADARYLVQEITSTKNTAPEYLKVKRVGKHLHLIFEDDTEASLIIEDYYDTHRADENALIGQAENGTIYAYIPEDPEVSGLVQMLPEGGQAVNVALGNAEVIGTAAAVATLFPLAPLLGFGAAGAAMLYDPGSPAPKTSPKVSVTSDKVHLGDGEKSTITFTLSEPSNDFTLSDVTVKGGKLSNFKQSPTNPLVYTAELTPDEGVSSVGIVVGSDRFSSASGLKNQDGSEADNAVALTVTCDPIPTTADLTPPTVAIARTGTGPLTGTASETITFTLSEASKNFTASDIAVTGGTLSQFRQSTTNPLAYSAVFTPTPGAKGQAYIGVAAGKFTDAMGNLNTDTYVTGTGWQADNLVTLPIDASMVTAAGPFAVATGTTVPASLSSAQSQAVTALQNFLGQNDALQRLFPIFNGTLSAPDTAWDAAASDFLTSFQAGTATVRIELRSSLELRNAQGAYSPTGTTGQPTIYLNADWLATSPSASAIERVLLEEYGHYIDKRINAADTVGDEGELFSYEVLGQTLSAAQLDAIRVEDDRLTITIDGEPVLVEMASLLFAREAYFTSVPITLEQNISTLGARLSGVKFLFVSDPPEAPYYSGNNVRGYLYAVDASNNVITSYYGEISRLIKTGSTVDGCQFYVYPNPASPSTGTAATTIIFGVTTTFDNANSTGSTVRTSSDPVATALNALITPNQAPTAVADSGTGYMPSCSTGQTLTNATGNVLTNDSDTDTKWTIDTSTNPDKMVPAPGSGMTVTNITSSATAASAAVTAGTNATSGSTVTGLYGTLTIGADGSYVYDVNELLPALTALPQGSTVTETFTYTVSDGQGGVATATLTLTIYGGNNAPTAVNDFQAVTEVAINALQASGTTRTNDSDPDSGDTFGVVSASTGQTLSASPTTITATGATTISGTAAYTYSSVTFQNGQQTSLVGYQVYKNGSPTGIYLATVGGSGGKTMTFRDASGAAASLATLTTDTLSFVSGATTVAAGPITALSAPDTTRFFVNGSTSTITVGSTITGEGIAAGTTVTAVNGNYITLSSPASVGTTSTTLSAGDSLSIQSGVIYGQYGYLNLKSDGTYQYYLTTNVPSNTVVNDYFSYKIQDVNGCSSTAVLQIQIQGDQVNPPTGNADTANVNESPTSSGGTPVTGNLLSNDTGGVSPLSLASAWTVSTASTPTSVSAGTTLVGTYGTLTLNPDGSYSYALNNANPTVDALRLSTDTLTETFYYRVKDSQATAAFGTSTLTITIRGVNDAPVAVNDTATAVEASGLNNTTPGFNPTGNVLLNDTDVDSGDTKTVSAIAGGTLGSGTAGTYGTLTLNSDGSYTYVVNNSNPAVEALKSSSTPLTDTFTYTVTDTSGATSTATLTVSIRGADDTVYTPDIFVNEGSSHAVFSVQSGAGQQLSLALAAGTAASGTDYTNALQYWNGSAWTNYSSGNVTVPSSGVLLVRVAITNDTVADNGETFTLTATNLGGTAYTATAAILDDGTGTLFTSANPVVTNGVPTPAVDTTTLLNDDRPLTVNSVTVNEASPYIVFQVTGAPEQYLRLSTTDVTATSADYGPQWQYFDGSTWVNYTAGSHVQIPAGGTTLLVRTTVTQDTTPDNGETFTLTATNTGGIAANGTGTIKDDSTGEYFAADNNTGTPALPTGTVLDDDRALSVNNLTVNEGSPYAVFTVGGREGQSIGLELAAVSATAGADYTSALEYWNGTAWVAYNPGSQVSIPSDGDGTIGEVANLLVRVAITNDTVADNNETFTLKATNTGGGSATGTATIKDDGTGDWFAADNSTGTPALPANTVLNDDRPLSVNNLTVNEGSPYATFTVTAASGQLVKLALTNGSASLATATPVLDGTMDYGPALEYWNGSAWTAYTANSFVAVPSGSTSLLVRTAIVNDISSDNNQTFTLTATNTGGTPAVGTGTIMDDGTGNWFAADNNSGTPALPTGTQLNDDRPLSVNSVTVNESSPFINFTVTAASGQLVKLELGTTGTGTGHAALGTDTSNAGTSVPLQYFNGTSWVDYTAGSFVSVPSGSTSLLVRTGIQNDTTADNNETFTLTATNTGGGAALGTGTIKDDGTGGWFAIDNNTGTPSLPANTVLNDDRPITVNDLDVNEGSPYATFTVTAASGQLIQLSLANGATNPATMASSGTPATDGSMDYGPALEYWNGSAWTAYTANSYVAVPAGSTSLLVRTAIVNDTLSDNNQTFTLTATSSGNAGDVGTATIHDDGTGDIFKYSSNTSPTPLTPGDTGYPALDDDRAPSVSGTTVNEASPYVMFTVGGVTGQKLSLTLGNTSATTDVDATLGTDTALASTLEYWNGTTWTAYTGGFITMPSSSVLVRLAVRQDGNFENAETLTLTAATTSGTSATGTSTIKDDGTGDLYTGTVSGGTPVQDTTTPKDDDRVFSVNSVTVTEAANATATFTVTGNAGQQVKLDLQPTTNTSDNAAVSGANADVASTIDYSLDGGATWVTGYTPGSNTFITLTGSTMQVRVGITRDVLVENAETYKLQVTNSSGNTITGLGTILDNVNPVAAPDTATAVEAGTALAVDGGNNSTGTNPTGNVITSSDTGTAGETLSVASAFNSGVSTTPTTVTSGGVNITGLYGTLNLSADGSYTYTVNNSNTAVQALRLSSNTLTDTFSYTISDGFGGTATSTLSLTVQGSNDAPTAAPDYNTAKESLIADGNATQYSSTDPLGYKATGNVLPNDSDVDGGDGKSIVGLSGNAAVSSVTSNGSTSTLVFTPGTTFSPVGNGDEAWYWLDVNTNNTPDNGEWRAMFFESGGTYTQVTATGPYNSTTRTIPLSATPTHYSNGSGGYVAISGFSNVTVGFANSTSSTVENNSGMKSGVVSSTQTTGTTTVSLTVGTPSGTVAAGMEVTGTGVPAGTTISTVNYDGSGNPTSVLLSSTITSTAGTVLTFSAAAGATVSGKYGTLNLGADGSYTYTPFANNTSLVEGQSVSETFTYSMQDTLTAPSTSTLTIQVLGSGTNDPNAIDDVNSLIEAGGTTPATSAVGNVLGTAGTGTAKSTGDVTDTTPVGTLVVTGVRAPDDATLSGITAGSSTQIDGLYGQLTLHSNGSYTYSLNQSNPAVQALGTGATLTEKFIYQVKNGQTFSGNDLQDVATLTITINGTNDAPVLDLNIADSGSANYTNTFTEGGSAAPLMSTGVHLSDVDSTLFNRVTLSFSQSAFPDGAAEELVASGATAGGTLTLGGLADGTTNGTLTVGGVVYDYTRVVGSGTVSFVFTKDNGATLSAAEMETLLGSLSYRNTSDNPTTGSSRVFSLTAQDNAGLDSNTTTSTITVVPVNDGPALDLDADNSTTATGADHKGSFTVGGVAVAIADTDSSVTDVDSANMSGATIVLTNAKVGDTVSVSGLPSGITASAATTTASADGTLTLTLSGTATKAAYEAALEAIRFATTSATYTDRVFQVSVTDGSLSTNTAVSTLSVLPDNRPITVTGTTVNEASPYVLFSVSGTSGQNVTLELGATGTGTGHASLGVDTTFANASTSRTLQYLVGSTWTDYTPGSTVTLGSGPLLVRTGVVNETPYEGPETLNLVGRNAAGTAATGTSTIVDNGTGDYFAAGNTTSTPSLPSGTVLDDDRVLAVNNVTVNEGSPFINFTVTGVSGQLVKLSLGNTSSTSDVDAILGTDTGNANTVTNAQLQYFNGTGWVDYTPNSFVAIPPGGTTLLVRTAIVNDSPAVAEGPETFTLTATNAGGDGTTGIGTIVDDGTGSYFAPDNNTGTSTLPANTVLDDDRALTINSIVVNEGSPKIVFTVTGASDQLVKLQLANGSALLASSTPVLDGSMDYGPALEYWNGSGWQPYTAGSYVAIPTGSTSLLVRTAIVNDTVSDNAQTFTLTAFNTANASVVGTGTIMDDGTGNWFDTANNTGTPALPANAVLNDDRTLTVNNVNVNEGSAYAVFTVGGKEGQSVQLALGTGTATAGSDYTSAMEYWNGSAWVAYTTGSYVTIPSDGDSTTAEAANLLVRVAITNDTVSDNGETFTLTATNTGGNAATGTGTISDDGTGTLFATTPTGASGVNPATADTLATPQTLTPADPATTPVVNPATTPVLNDDRTLTVNSITVNEGSPYAVFTVGGKEGQYVQLDLGTVTGTATAGTDYTNALEYWNGTDWVAYATGNFVAIPSDGDGTTNESTNLLVRVAITNDTVSDNGETFTLTATNTGGTGVTGTGTIKDDGTGTLFPAADPVITGGVPSPVVDTTSTLNDDRPLSVNNLTVNEGSPYATFTVTAAAAGQLIKLNLANGSALAASATPVTDGTMDYGPALEYWNGSTWTSYTANSYVAVPNGGTTLLVRTPIVNDSASDNGETFTLTATNTGGTGATGTATIKDDGSGSIFQYSSPNSPTPLAPTDPAYPVLNDDRPLTIDNVTVNEGSTYAVFTVGGKEGQSVLLTLTPGTATATDYGSTLQYWNGSTWAPYTAGSYVTIPSDGDGTTSEAANLLVRMAIVNDTVADNGETFTLTATNTGGTGVTGTGTIKDDGTGTLFADAPVSATASTPAVPQTLTAANPAITPVVDPTTTTVLNDDRPLSVNNVTVNEGSPYVTFSVTAASGQFVKLALTNGTALMASPGTPLTDGTMDYGRAIEYWNGTSWTPYTNGTFVTVPTGSTSLLVRTAIVNDNASDSGETFTLKATNTGGIDATGTGTITDDGTGSVFIYSSPTDPAPLMPTDSGYPAVLDDDRPLSVDSIRVNEASPYATFTVTGNSGQLVSLSLGATGTGNGHALVGTDTANAGSTGPLQYFNGSAWVDYTPGSLVAIPAGSNTLLVRTALTNDSSYEGPETLNLTAANTNGTTATGIGTILDDGTGNIYQYASPGSPAPLPVTDPAYPMLDDDRPLTVNSIDVNENSPYAVFTVSGAAGQLVQLGLGNTGITSDQDASLNIDTANAGSTALQYFNGTTWVDYTPGVPVPLSGTGTLMVRTRISDDTVYEGAETFTLLATNSGGNIATGVGTIHDDGTGAIYPDNTTGTPDLQAVLDDDRSLQVNNIEVNENSPYAVFTVTGTALQAVNLSLSGGSALLGTDTAAAGTLQWFNGSVWTSAGTPTTDASGQLLVRIGVTDDTVYEGAETFTLSAAMGTVTGTGTATILDDGRGTIYPDTPTGNPDPLAVLDDDRSVQVNNIEVNEGSPYAVFNVTGTAMQAVTLSLASGSALLGTDTAAASSLEWFNGYNWTSAGTPTTNASGQLLVRIRVTQDAVYEGAETFTLSASIGAASATGTATIFDDGTGAIYTDNTTGNPEPSAKRDDDRAVQVNNIEVNENSPYAVFTVKPADGSANTYVKLGLQNDNDPTLGDATLGTDAGVALQYFDGTSWTDYTPGTAVLLPATGLLVRTAITDDNLYEGPETFVLNATVTNSSGTNNGMASYGIATILDDGTGAIYPDNTTGNPDPTLTPDDDRTVQVNSIEVNEASPYAVFTVTAPSGTWLKLSLQNENNPLTANAVLGTDTANAGGSVPLQYFNGTSWVDYTAGSAVQMPVGSTTLLVRTGITEDAVYEGPEVFLLNATVTNSAGTTTGMASYGSATILDDGRGDIYPNNNNGSPDPTAAPTDDRAVQVNNVDVNEASPYAVFTVKTPGGATGTYVKLGLQNNNDPTSADASLGTDTANAGNGVPLQYFNGTNWLDYTPGSAVLVPASGLLVRTAITPDTVYEGPETFQLSATVTNSMGSSNGLTSYGTGTILDNGTGGYFASTNNTPTPALPAGIRLDDDRDSTPPTIAIASSKSALAAGDTATITFTLSEISLNFNIADVVVAGGSLSNFQGSGTSYTATFTAGLTSDARTVFVDSQAFSDAAGNFNTDGSDANNRVSMGANVQTPTIAVTASKSMLMTGETSQVTFTLSEASTDFSQADITVVGGKLSNFAGSGTSYTATFTPTSCSTNGFVVVSSNKFSNANGIFNQDGLDLNNGVAFNSVASNTDTAQPTIAILSDHSSLQYGETAQVTFLLSHNSTDFSQSDVLVTGGTLSNFQGSGAMYTATFTPAAGVNSAILFVDSNKFQSVAGTANQDGLDANNALSLLIGSHGCDDVYNVNLSDVLEVAPTRCLGQYILKVEGDANDTVNLSSLLDSGQQTGTWSQSGTVSVDNQLYNLWTHSGNSQAYLLIDTDIHTVNANMH